MSSLFVTSFENANSWLGSIHARCKLNFLEDTDTLGSEISNLDTSYLIVFANWLFSTGKSFSEALILASTNPQYDERLFIALRVQYMITTSSEHVVYINCSECQNKNKEQFLYTCSKLYFSCTEFVIQ